MGRLSNKVKLTRILEDNGYYLEKEYYVDDRKNDPHFHMPSWLHKETKEWITADASLDKDLKFLLKYGIDKELGHGIGLSSKDQLWYGWTHRGIAYFGIGTHVKKGNVAYTADNVYELYYDIIQWNKDYSDFNIDCYKIKDNTVVIEYPMIQCKLGKECPKLKHELEFDADVPYPPEVKAHECEYVEAESEFRTVNIGKGEWTAKTLEDAKEMAIAFRNGIS